MVLLNEILDGVVFCVRYSVILFLDVVLKWLFNVIRCVIILGVGFVLIV